MNNKTYKTGLVIGKFYPFHLGHQFLLETAIKQCQRLTVIVCQTDRYQIPVEIRAKWIRNTFPDANVRIFHHDPEMDSDSVNVSEKWAEITVRFLKFIPVAVFSSESYGEPYARYMGSKHVLVDLNRKRVTISGTRIRNDLKNNWNYLTPESKAYFAKRIVIVGAESTGTTTLTQDLARQYKTAWVPEYGRAYYEGKMTSPTLNNWQTSEFVHIASIQNQIENSLSKHANKVVFCDTNAFATEIWHERYVGFMSNAVKKVSQKALVDLYIVTDTDIPFVQDGTRDGQHQRQHMHNRFIEELNKRKLPYIVVSGPRKNRLKQAMSLIDPLLSSWKV
ncbi:hypothetical protein A2572_01925 [Candidatus Collierbacteria bacterium RIFOXYD1_FULL_40_9]|uniref:NadR/Ttd14 AAA domain-containing protein n=1 Tax=Candidatus Collierbacteria bacterium RIFOXYD1_FULL_40_9 TaxID=1817731 RepID=A0A1F5FUC3_9BACT|nr:MAG: hypothetical protein A2572_01925 [Candidatus Collierbacteria bacterium RIFOXYD1_FULL_40_9]